MVSDDRHFPEARRQILHVVLQSAHQFLGKLGGEILAVGHGRQPLVGNLSLDDGGRRQLGRHQTERLVLHGVGIVEHINLHLGRGLVDPPASAGRLPEHIQVESDVVEYQGGKSIQIEAGFHKGRIGD